MSVLFVKQRSSVYEPPFRDLGVTYAIDSEIVGKLVVDFLWVSVIIEHFSLAFTAETPRAKIRRNRPLLKGVGHLEAKY